MNNLLMCEEVNTNSIYLIIAVQLTLMHKRGSLVLDLLVNTMETRTGIIFWIKLVRK